MAANLRERIIAAGNGAWHSSIHWREDAYLAAAREALTVLRERYVSRVGFLSAVFVDEIDKLLAQLTPKETPDGDRTMAQAGVVTDAAAVDGDRERGPEGLAPSLTPDAALLEKKQP